MYDLKFVNLGITIEHMVSSVNVFGFRIAFYGIIIGIGMLLGIMLAAWDAEDRGLGEDVIYDHVFWVIVIGIMGARLYYVFFQWDAYKDDLLQILNLRAGGLAIYGGVIAGLTTLYVLCRRKKLSFLDVADSLMLAVLVGQILGRWGNFFNCEAFGRYTESLFAMRIRKAIVNPIMIDAELLEHIIIENGTEYIQVHPTFLYESFWNFCLLMFLLWYRKRKKFTGEIFLLYLCGYGLGRCIIEGLRTDSLLIPGTGIAVSQLLAGTCFVVSLFLILLGRKRAVLKPAEAAKETKY
ncbi:MAG: prolipoprotein diacylglyceryl transferase [Stomatobaculum sp.]|nr:prolipoprotein diacylglyceryl transferase [Stomatobaculum sp.]